MTQVPEEDKQTNARQVATQSTSSKRKESPKRKEAGKGSKKRRDASATSKKRRRVHKLPPGLPGQSGGEGGVLNALRRHGLAITVCLCLPLGFVLGRMSAPERSADDDAMIFAAPSSGNSSGELSADTSAPQSALLSAPTVPEVSGVSAATQSDGNLDRLYKAVDTIDSRLFAAFTRRVYALDEEQHRQSLMRLVMRRWIATDAQAALDYALSLSDEPARFETIDAALELYGAADPVAALAWAEALPDDQYRLKLIDNVYDVIASSDPIQALTLLEQLPDDSQQKANASVAIMYHWVRQDSGAAFDWLNSIPDDQLRQDLYNTTMYRWVLEYPEEAAEVISRMPSGPDKLQLVAQYTFQAAQRDPEQTTLWASNIEDDVIRQHALITALDQWAQQDTSSAVQFISELPDDAERRQLSESIGATLAARDPNVAANAMYQFDPDLQIFLAERIATGLAETDPGAADQWYGSISDIDVKRAALYGLIDHYIEVNPEYGFNLALDSDANERTALMQQTIEALARFDPGAARRVIGSAPLSDEERQLLSVTVNSVVYPTN